MKLFVAFTAVALILSIAHADDPPVKSDRAEVVKFLKAKVIGKTLETKSTSRIANGMVEAVFEARRTFSNLVETNQGFTFDVLIEIKQTNYDLDDQGKRTSASHNKDRTYVGHYMIGEKLSTGELIGMEVDLFSNDPDAYPYSPQVVRMDVEGDALIMAINTVLYQDFYGKQNRFTPGAVETRYEFRVEDGRLVARQTTRAYNVDPKTLDRTPQSEQQRVHVHHQVN